MKYHNVSEQDCGQLSAEAPACVPEHEFSLCTRFPVEDFATKRVGADGQQKMDVLAVKDLDWFRVEDTYEQILSHKLDLISRYRDLVYAVTPQAGEGAREALKLAGGYLADRYPARFSMEQDELIDLRTHRKVRVAGEVKDPLLSLASLVDEDLVVMELDKAGTYRVSAACACCPSHWSIHQKLGKTLKDVHKPVPNLNLNIGDQLDQLMSNLPAMRPVGRINMLVNFDPRWSQFPAVIQSRPYPHATLEKSSIGDRLFLRNERETITKLPETQAILFTIKTYQVPFTMLPEWACKKLADYHDSFDRVYRDDYRKLSHEEHELVVQWLRERAVTLGELFSRE